ncbi:MAG: hypothetical protein ACM3O3_10775 [Syntrophothermus sp.]
MNNIKNILITILFCLASIFNSFSQEKEFHLMVSRMENKQIVDNAAKTFIAKILKKEIISTSWIFLTSNTKEIENSNKIILDFFEDGKYIAEMIKVDKISSSKFLWKGKIGEAGTATIFYNNEKVTASINTEFETYRIEPLQDGIHLLLKNDKKMIKKAKCGNENFAIQNKHENDIVEHLLKGIVGTPKQDILIAYTPEVAANHVDMEGFIQTIIGDAETVYSNSDISIDLRLVHSLEINYTESGSLENDKIELKK